MLAKSDIDRVSPRLERSMPASRDCSNLFFHGFRLFLSIFRLCKKAAFTILKKSCGSSTCTLGCGSGFNENRDESIFGRGEKAVLGISSKRSTWQWYCT